MAQVFRLDEKLVWIGRHKRLLFLLLLLVIALLLLWLINSRLQVLPLVDFVEYWASGRLNLTGGNPYDAGQMMAVEQSAGWRENEALMMLNPPWVLSYTMFLAIFSYPSSRFLGFLLQIFIVCVCAIMLWRVYAGSQRKNWIAWLVVLSFGPVLHALKTGQVSILVLLGSVGFLYFTQKKSDFLAGILFSLVFFKPHLLYLLILAVVVWSISRKRYYCLLGTAASVSILLLIAWMVNPHVISQYIAMASAYAWDNWMNATLGAYLRLLVNQREFYLQFVPILFGMAWFLVYWLRYKKSFEWKTNLPLITLISIATAPYGWTTDFSLCVVGVLHVTALFDFSSWSFKKILIFMTYWCANLLIILLRADQSWFWWFPSFLLIWYVVSREFLLRSTVNMQNPEVSFS